MRIKLKKFKTVKSTNDIAIKCIKKNLSQPTLITSTKQTNGRGRAGKKWVSKKGNLFITIYFKLDQKRLNFKHFAILNALLIKNLIEKKISKNIKIKWPNDLLFKEKKFCGILQEIVNFDKYNYLIVGIGLNTNITPQNKSFKSTCLKNILKEKIDNKIILKNILIAYEKFLSLAKTMSFSELKRKYK